MIILSICVKCGQVVTINIFILFVAFLFYVKVTAVVCGNSNQKTGSAKVQTEDLNLRD